ncbi:hypothetical protein ACNFU2_06405 [Chryseobacterium sp. PTM-20240506]|uniref:hypothetical protein n=1 Tax=Chryseobacterium sp. PTM-20240506 TaxID=3400631 RepID=UPI003AAC1CDB
MNDYIQVMKDLIKEHYSNTPEGNKVEMQTSDVLKWFRGVIPGEPINQHDVFDVLTEMEYKKSQKILTKQVQTKKGNKNLGIEPEFKDVEIGRILVWDLYDKLE